MILFCSTHQDTGSVYNETRQSVERIKLPLMIVGYTKTFIDLQKVAYSVINRDNKRQVGLYHEKIYSASVVYQIN